MPGTGKSDRIGRGGAHGLLAAFYRGPHGMKSDAGLARFYSRRAWLLGSRFQNPFKTPDEMRAYITDMSVPAVNFRISD